MIEIRSWSRLQDGSQNLKNYHITVLKHFILQHLLSLASCACSITKATNLSLQTPKPMPIIKSERYERSMSRQSSLDKRLGSIEMKNSLGWGWLQSRSHKVDFKVDIRGIPACLVISSTIRFYILSSSVLQTHHWLCWGKLELQHPVLECEGVMTTPHSLRALESKEDRRVNLWGEQRQSNLDHTHTHTHKTFTFVYWEKSSDEHLELHFKLNRI